MDQAHGGVARALGAGGLRRLEAGRLLLGQLQAAYEAPAAAAERGRAARALMFGGDRDAPTRDGMLGFITGMLDGSLRSSALFDVSDVTRRLDAEQARCVLFAAAARLASGTAGYFSFAEMISDELATDDLAMTPADVRLLAAVSAPAAGTPDIGVAIVAADPYQFALHAADRLLTAGTPGAAQLAEDVAAQAAAWHVRALSRYSSRVDYTPRLVRLRDRALALAGYPPQPRFEGPVGLVDGLPRRAGSGRPRTGRPVPPPCSRTACSPQRAVPLPAGRRSAGSGSTVSPTPARCCSGCSGCSPPRRLSASLTTSGPRTCSLTATSRW